VTDEEQYEDHPDSLSAMLEGALADVESAGQANYGVKPSLDTDGAKLPGLSTGFADLDALTGGLTDGSLTVIASRPSMGRTTLLTDICRSTAIRLGVPTLVFTLEESGRDFSRRVLCAEGRVAQHRLRSGGVTDDDWTRLSRRMTAVANAPLFIKAPPRINMLTLAEQAQEMMEKEDVQFIAVDGIQDIRPEKRSDLREREVGDVVRDLKTLARELDVPILATSHLNRGPESRVDKRPRLDDLRESGAITFAADTIVLLHREDYYELDSPRAGEADLFVAKHRQGPTAFITVAFQGHYGRFIDMAAT
jgi:replicative DNA helicase